MVRFEAETIHLDNLRVRCIVGVRPDERNREQLLIVSLSFSGDFSRAAESEALEHTIDYSEVAAATREFMQAGKFRLLESLARSLGSHLCERFGLSRLELHVHKPEAIADCDGPAVSLTVTREGP